MKELIEKQVCEREMMSLIYDQRSHQKLAAAVLYRYYLLSASTLQFHEDVTTH